MYSHKPPPPINYPAVSSSDQNPIIMKRKPETKDRETTRHPPNRNLYRPRNSIHSLERNCTYPTHTSVRAPKLVNDARGKWNLPARRWRGEIDQSPPPPFSLSLPPLENQPCNYLAILPSARPILPLHCGSGSATLNPPPPFRFAFPAHLCTLSLSPSVSLSTSPTVVAVVVVVCAFVFSRCFSP